MIPQITEHFKPLITNVPWVERYGGLVKIVHKKMDDKLQTFPVSCNISEEDCFRNGRYQELVPDSSFKSIVYWQEDRPTGIKRDKKSPLANYNALTFQSRLKLVVWLNMADFGKLSCDEAPLFASELIGKMTKFHEKFEAPYKIERFSLIPSQISTDPEVAFKGLTYEKDGRLKLYPFASLAIFWDLRWDVLPGCLPNVDITAPVNCVDFSL